MQRIATYLSQISALPVIGIDLLRALYYGRHEQNKEAMEMINVFR